MRREEILCAAEAVGKKPPETLTADFCARAIETVDWSLGSENLRVVDRFVNAQPVAYGRDLSKRDARLRHPEWAGIHPEKDNALFPIRVSPQIGFVRGPSVIERIVNVCDRRSEMQFVDRITQTFGRRDYSLRFVVLVRTRRSACIEIRENEEGLRLLILEMTLALCRFGVLVFAQNIFLELHVGAQKIFKPRLNSLLLFEHFFGE